MINQYVMYNNSKLNLGNVISKVDVLPTTGLSDNDKYWNSVNSNIYIYNLSSNTWTEKAPTNGTHFFLLFDGEKYEYYNGWRLSKSGDAETVNGHVIEQDLLSTSKLTDTIYDDTTVKQDITNLQTDSHTHTNKATIDKFGEDVNGNPTYNGSSIQTELPIATTSVLGGVKPDGTTITVTADGTISSTSSGGTTDYADLTNKPSINGVELSGEKTLTELGIQPSGSYLTSIPAEYVTDSELTAKGYALSTDIPNVSNKLVATNIKAGTNVTVSVNGNDVTVNSTATSETTDYIDLTNKPKINGVELSGDKTLDDLGVQIMGDYALKSELSSINSIGGTMSILGDSGILVENDTVNKTITISRTDLASGTLPPMNVSGKSIESGNAKAILKWVDPNNTVVDGQTLSIWQHTILVRKTGSYPSNENDGTIVLTNSVRNQYASVGYKDTGLTNGVMYYYRFFPVSTLGAINRDLDNRISVIPIHYSTMTAVINLSNSNPATCITYADDATSMTAGSTNWDTFFGNKPCLFKDGAVVCYLNPSNFTKDINGNTVDITSGSAGDVMIEFPRRGLKITTVGTTLTVSMTDNPYDSNFEYNAHTRDTTYKDYFYLGAYKGYNLSSKLRSLSGKTPTASQTISQFRTLAQANGSGYEQSAFYQLIFRQCMYILKYKNLNSQTALGRGYVDANASIIATGGTNLKGMNFGETTGKLQMKLFGIEDFWGNMFEFIDGLVTDGSRNILTTNNNFNDTGSGYTNNGQGATSNIGNYMSKPQGNTNTGFIIKEASGSATTYFCDSAYLYASCIAYFGGSYTHASAAGVFMLPLNNIASFSGVAFTARLMYL